MAREYDRPATIAALVNAAVVYLLPLAFIAVIAMLTDPHRLGSSVTAHGPDYLSNVAKATVAYVTGCSSDLALASCSR
jgi:hypothetical protein